MPMTGSERRQIELLIEIRNLLTSIKLAACKEEAANDAIANLAREVADLRTTVAAFRNGR